MRIAHKIKLNPTKSQIETFNFWIRKCHYLYNVGLEEKLEYYRKTNKYLSPYEQKKELVEIKKYDSSWKDVPNKCLSDIIFRLDKAFQKFFKEKEVRFPKFKNIENFKSINFVKTDIKLLKNKLYFPKIKQYIKLTENITNLNWTSVILKKENNYYFVIFNYENENIINKPNILGDQKLKDIGIDLGLSSLLTDSDGYKIKRFSTKLIKKYQKRIGDLNRSLSTKQIRSKNWFKVISLGDIVIKSILDKSKDLNKSKRFLRRSFQHNSVGIFKTMLTNKLEQSNFKVYKAKENYTSQTCSCCMRINVNLRLSDRIYNCEFCNLTIDRDENSAINMKAVWQGQFKPHKGLNSFGNKIFIPK